jgi:hypothetical protein
MEIKRLNSFGESSLSLLEKREYHSFIEGWQSKMDQMIAEGKSTQEINESFWDIFSGLGGGFTKTLEDYAVSWVLNKFGIQQKDAEGNDYFLAMWARATITSVDFMHFTQYFGKGSCNKWTEALIEGLERAGINKLSMVLLDAVGLKPTSGFTDVLAKTLSNSLTNYIRTKEFSDHLSDAISGTLCGTGGMKFKDIFAGASTDDKKKIGQNLSQQSESDPSVIKAAQKTGILSLLGLGS